MADSLESTSSGWSSLVLILSTTIPLILFWKPLRHSINEYRLYRRCQQYPHIVVCKDNSSTTISDRKSGGGIVGWVIPIGMWMLSALLSLLGVVMNKFTSALASKLSKKESTTTEIHMDQMTTPKGAIEHTMKSSEIGFAVQTTSLRPLPDSSPTADLNRDAKVQRVEMTGQNLGIQRHSEEIFESSFQTDEKVDLAMQNGLDPMTSKPLIQQSQSGEIRRRSITMYSRAQKQRLQTQIVTRTNSVSIDSSSLSEKMRKRRLNGSRTMEYNAKSGEGDEGRSKKRRKLNAGRVSLQGCAVRHPRAGAWQSTKILNKREREEREERLLRSMSRKRVKPIVEEPKLAASTTALTTAPTSSTPAFNFGQTSAATSTNQNAPSAKQETPVTPAPAFKFGGNETAGAEKKEEQAAKTPAFSFGNPSAKNTADSSATSNKSHAAAAASAPTPAAPFQFGGPSSGTSGDTKNKGQATEQVPPKFGTAPSSKTTSVPSFGAAPSASAQAQPPAAPAPTFGTSSAAPAAPGSGTPAVPSFGGTPAAASAVPTFSAAPAPSSFGAPASVAQGLGTTTVPPTTFGAQPAPATSTQPAKPANAPPFSFGNTKENTNPGGFNSTFQAPAPSNGFLKPQPGNGAAPSFGGGNIGAGFSAGALPASSSGASARRLARRARARRR